MSITQQIAVGSYVEGGTPGTDEYDFGQVTAINGDEAEVAWFSGVSTTTDLTGLRLLSESEYRALRER